MQRMVNRAASRRIRSALAPLKGVIKGLGPRAAASARLNASVTSSRPTEERAHIRAAAAVGKAVRQRSSSVKLQAASRAKAKTKAAAIRPSSKAKGKAAKRPRLNGGALPTVRSGRALGSRRQLPAPLIRRQKGNRRRTAVVPRISSAAYRSGFRVGKEDGKHITIEREPNQKKALNRLWLLRPQAKQWAAVSWRHFNEASRGYMHGFSRAKKQNPHKWVLLPTDKSVAAVISVRNEEHTIGAIMHQLNRLPLDQVYVIVNGSEDRSFIHSREKSHAVVLSFPEPLGHDVGRAMGARLADADILLFLDGDIVIPAEELVSFVGGIERGLDVALNNIIPYMRLFAQRDQVTHMKQFLNASLGRSDLEANSMTAVPHAISRKAVNTLGIPSLMVPPKAQVLAVHHGLKVATSGSVNVIRSNKRRAENTGRSNQVADLIIGDHLEALKLAGDLAGERLSFKDKMRLRVHAGGED